LSENDYLDMQDLNYEFNKLMYLIFRQLNNQIEVLKLSKCNLDDNACLDLCRIIRGETFPQGPK
jgi:hypothetical protein